MANGELYRPDILRNRIRAEVFDLVMGADAGAHHARTLNIVLDVIVGDMDSISDLARQNASGAELVSYPAEKDETDLELALLYARKRGAGRIVMVGAMGGRMDMTVSNILLMTHPGLSPCRVEVWHGDQTGWLIKPPGDDITGRFGDTVSLIPLGGDASGITTRGLKHSLDHGTLTFGPGRGISNVLNQSSASVRLTKGFLFAVHTPGRT
ncbi:MAG: thiamine diphosphokinase [Dehalococcoidia bacterium]|nr:thiamine diphosphokinase [Dehalococcoidia bacterium]